ncbi:MAG: GNAT family N-acetyltransferase [Acidobacteria bacterium]|nr:GNAT family N-acetyltransferase [Acidobacteriota bacterium]
MNVLETERLVIRRLRASDLDELSALCCDAELMRYVGDGRPLGREQVQLWIERSLDNYARRGFGCMAVTEKSDGRLIGYCGLVYAPGSDEAEIIYALKREFWGRGLASEAARAMIAYGLNEHRLPRILATIDPDNLSSIRIVEKLGLKFLTRRVDEHGLPELVYAIEREED